MIKKGVLLATLSLSLITSSAVAHTRAQCIHVASINASMCDMDVLGVPTGEMAKALNFETGFSNNNYPTRIAVLSTNKINNILTRYQLTGVWPRKPNSFVATAKSLYSEAKGFKHCKPFVNYFRISYDKCRASNR